MSMYPLELEIQEIKAYLEKLIFEVYEEIFGNVIIKEEEYFSGIKPTFQMTMIYNKEHNKLYLMYLIDRYSRKYSSNYELVYKRISGRIINTCWADLNTKLRIEVINNPYYPTTDRGMKNSPLAPKDCIRMNTISIFKDFDEEWRFLEDEAISKLNMSTKIYFDLDDSEPDKGIPDKLNPFIEQLVELNEKYGFKTIIDRSKDPVGNEHNFDNIKYDNSDIPKAFEEFSNLYKTFFGIELLPISNDNIITSNYVIDYL